MVGGLLTGKIPWQVLVSLGGSQIGGGALIGDRWVLTAGRNLFHNKSHEARTGDPPSIPKVYLGITHLREMEESFNEAEVAEVILHPSFQNTSDWDNDLALIKLKHKLAFEGNKLPLYLPEKEYAVEDTYGIVAGWGWGALLKNSELLKTLTLRVANFTMCQQEFINQNWNSSDKQKLKSIPDVDENMFCTEATKYEENVCFGDAGAGFVVQDPENGKKYLAGILSFDKSCRVDKYAVYMKLTAYLPWIMSTIGPQ
ncbi:HPT protein, partial [Amia calva]|nr:HPT protein [Amia calva]